MGKRHRLRRQAEERRIASVEAAWALTGVQGGKWKGRGLLAGWDVVLKQRDPAAVFELKLEPGWGRTPEGLLLPHAMRALLDLVAPKRFFNPSTSTYTITSKREAAIVFAVLSEDALREVGKKCECGARHLVLDAAESVKVKYAVACIVEPWRHDE